MLTEKTVYFLVLSNAPMAKRRVFTLADLMLAVPGDEALQVRSRMGGESYTLRSGVTVTNVTCPICNGRGDGARCCEGAGFFLPCVSCDQSIDVTRNTYYCSDCDGDHDMVARRTCVASDDLVAEILNQKAKRDAKAKVFVEATLAAQRLGAGFERNAESLEKKLVAEMARILKESCCNVERAS